LLPDYLSIHIEFSGDDDGRVFQLRPVGDRWTDRLPGLAEISGAAAS
jgi:hypothetical protein